MAGSEPGGVWFVVAGAGLAVFASFWLRTRMPALVIAVLLAASGAGIGWGGMLLQSNPSIPEVVLAVVTLAVLVPFHVRVVVGPFGPPRGGGGETRVGE
jgi:hypothetical protein